MLTVDVVDFEEELDFVLRSLSSKLVDSIDELLEGNWAAVIFVEDLEDSLHKEWLQRVKCINSLSSQEQVTYVEDGINIQYSH